MAYQLDDLVSKVQRKAKDTSFSQTDIIDFLNDVQRETLGRHFYSFMEKTDSSPLAVSQSTVGYPADHQSTFDLVFVDPDDQRKTRRAEYLPHAVFFTRYQNPQESNEGMPEAWTDFGRQIVLSVPLDKPYILRHRYMRVPSVLSASTDVPDIPEEYGAILVNGALSELEEMRDNFDFAALYERKMEDLIEDMTVRYSPRQHGQPTMLLSPRRRQYTNWSGPYGPF